MRRAKPIALVTALVLILTQFGVTERAMAATSLNGHPVVTDGAGTIIPWTSDPAAGYGTVVEKAWDYLLNRVPNDPSTGKPAYFSQSYLNPDTQGMAGWPHNPAGLYAMLTESALDYYAYSGDIRPVNLAKQVASWQISNGLSKATDDWARVPYSSGDAGSLTYQGAGYGNSTGVGDGTGYLQPDKVGAMGYAWAQLYEFDGNTTYRDAAVAAADALVKHVRVGTATQSPWPFRVNAATGAIREQYTANVIDPIQLFDALIKLGVGDTAGYRSARQIAWNWLMAYPMVTNAWSNYFEDVPVQSDLSNTNQLIPMMTARYLLTHQAADPNWRSHVQGLISWVEANFGSQDTGATIIKEQRAFPYAMGSHTARYASVNALYSAATGDPAARTKAAASLNWATYMTRENGVVIDGPQVNNQWFTDGYGDYIRHFLTSMQAFPEWAPPGQSHLTGSTSLIKKVTFAAAAVSYSTADPASTESLRVAFRPTEVVVDGRSLALRADLTQEGWTFDASSQVLRIRHDSGTNVQVNAGAGVPGSSANAAPTVALTSPAPGTTVPVGSAVQLAATAADVDGSVTSVQFVSGSQPLATVTSSPYTYGWTPTTAGTYAISALATDDRGTTSRSASVTITVTSAPAPEQNGWSSRDIGSVGVTGAWSTIAGAFTVSGSGVDIWDAADSFRYVYQPLVGDGQITARVDSQGATDPWALSGVMIREDLSPGSRHVIAAITPGHGLSVTSRTQPGAMSDYSDGGPGSPPQWLRLTRSGNQFTASQSADGLDWTTTSSMTVPMATNAYVGLAVTSHDNSTLMTSTFSNVAVVGAGDTVGPVISDVTVGTANQNGAVITWTTDEPANSLVEYGASESYGLSTALNSSLVTDHSMVVSGLDAGATYHFRVKSRDASGNLAVGADSFFTTPAAPVPTTSPAPSTSPSLTPSRTATTEPTPTEPTTTTPTEPTTTTPRTPTATPTTTSTTTTSTTTPSTTTSSPTTSTTTTTTTPPVVSRPVLGVVSLRARVNGMFVTAEDAGRSPLIANRAASLGWEKFELVDLGGGMVALRAQANGLFVCAENGGTSSLIANRSDPLGWESFVLIRNADGSMSLQSMANSRYVAAENAGSAPLIANRTAIAGWEQFDLIRY